MICSPSTCRFLRGAWATTRCHSVHDYEEKEKYDGAEFPVVLDEDLQSDMDSCRSTPPSRLALRLMEIDELPTSRDVVVYKTLPNEMPRVAGVMTAVRQTPLLLRAIQDGVPNAFITDAAKNESITSLAGKLVYYKVDKNGYELREATEAEVNEHFAAIRPAEPRCR